MDETATIRTIRAKAQGGTKVTVEALSGMAVGDTYMWTTSWGAVKSGRATAYDHGNATGRRYTTATMRLGDGNYQLYITRAQ